MQNWLGWGLEKTNMQKNGGAMCTQTGWSRSMSSPVSFKVDQTHLKGGKYCNMNRWSAGIVRLDLGWLLQLSAKLKIENTKTGVDCIRCGYTTRRSWRGLNTQFWGDQLAGGGWQISLQVSKQVKPPKKDTPQLTSNGGNPSKRGPISFDSRKLREQPTLYGLAWKIETDDAPG